MFNDLNGNGTLDPGDPGLSGWTVDLLDSVGNIVATTVTDSNGDYSFSDLGPGTYTVQEDLQPGWVQTAPAPPGPTSRGDEWHERDRLGLRQLPAL